jgi:hypothetical protein
MAADYCGSPAGVTTIAQRSSLDLCHAIAMPKIFISYRRSDTGPEAGRLRTSLVHHFGRERIFRDKDSISPGVNWHDEVRQALSGDTIVLALIGKTWVTAIDATGQRLIDDSRSNNRLELETALRGGLKTIPVLVEGAEVPKDHELPDALRELLTINALRLRDDDWDNDAQKVIETLESLGVKPAGREPRGDRRWQRRPMPWLAAVAIVVGLVAVATRWYTTKPQAVEGPTDTVATSPSAPPNDAPNFQIVIDRSAIMNTRFGDGTRLDAAKKALVSVLQEKTADSDNLSLREFGGSCSELNTTRLVLPFAPGESRLAQGVNGLTTTSGTSTLMNAIVEATGDFSGHRGKNSGIIVIAGSYDRCGHSDPDSVIRDRLKRYPELELDLRFVGVALTRQAQSLARGLARTTGGTFRNATTPAELDEAVEQAIVVKTKVGEVQTAVEILNECLTHLNTAVATHLGSSLDYDAANREVAEAERALNGSAVPAPEPQHPEGVRQLLSMARQSRDDQQKMVEATKALIAAKQSNDAAAEARARRTYNQLVSAYNPRMDKINELQQQLLNSASPAVVNGN